MMEQDMFIIREARPEEAALISELAQRSKAYWGYNEAFLAAARADLTITPEYITTYCVFVLEKQGHVLGFYSLKDEEQDGEILLDNLFLDPEAIGHGHGKRLWEHAIANAKQRGCHTMVLISEPFAEGFYLSRGAERVGMVASGVVEGRLLPLMRVALK